MQILFPALGLALLGHLMKLPLLLSLITGVTIAAIPAFAIPATVSFKALSNPPDSQVGQLEFVLDSWRFVPDQGRPARLDGFDNLQILAVGNSLTPVIDLFGDSDLHRENSLNFPTQVFIEDLARVRLSSGILLQVKPIEAKLLGLHKFSRMTGRREYLEDVVTWYLDPRSEIKCRYSQWDPTRSTWIEHERWFPVTRFSAAPNPRFANYETNQDPGTAIWVSDLEIYPIERLGVLTDGRFTFAFVRDRTDPEITVYHAAPNQLIEMKPNLDPTQRERLRHFEVDPELRASFEIAAKLKTAPFTRLRSELIARQIILPPARSLLWSLANHIKRCADFVSAYFSPAGLPPRNP